jgi:concentrative nucleoside transporter, CNT family
LKKLNPLYLIALFAVFSALLFSSCKKEPSPLNGKWKLTKFENIEKDQVEVYSDTSELFIIFNESDSKFSDNSISLNTLNISGSYTYQPDSNLVKILFIDPETSYHIDSLSLEVDKNGVPTFKYHEYGQKFVEEVNGEITVMPIDLSFSVLELQDGYLTLYNKDLGVYVYQKSEKMASTFSVMNIFRGILGLAFFLFIAWIFSVDRKAIDWGLIGKGLALQIIIAFLVLRFPIVETGFDIVSQGFVWVIDKTDAGINFLFGQMGTGTVQAPLVTFAIKVLPTIIFFSALVSLFYYWGILQKVVYVFAWIMKKFMRLSGAESLAAAGNVFLGQTEAPLLVKPYLMGMTKSEIMCLMTGGMATIAGGVLAAYVGFLGGDDPESRAFFAKHLLTASIISAPAAIIAAKMLVPEKETINEDLKISKDKIGVNALEAISNGTSDGLKLAVNVGAMLLVFTALMALGNGGLAKIGEWTGLNEKIAEGGVYSSLSFEYLLGNLGRPIVWMMGIEWKDTLYVGELLGTKTVLNEFIAYPRLGVLKEAGAISERSILMSTYMLCGFANFASIGIQIGGIGALMPTRKGLLSQLGMRALLGGTIACILTAVIVGMMY